MKRATIRSQQPSTTSRASKRTRWASSLVSEKNASAKKVYDAEELFGASLQLSSIQVETYARIIAEREGCSLDICREQARLQLGAWKPSRPGKLPLKFSERASAAS